MSAKEYHGNLLSPIQELLYPLEFKNEWAAFTGLYYQYSPRVDIAVGPFSVTPGITLTVAYVRIIEEQSINKFLRKAFDHHVQNLDPLLFHEVNHPQFDYLNHFAFSASVLAFSSWY